LYITKKDNVSGTGSLSVTSWEEKDSYSVESLRKS
jgi:hypothetical protein